MTADRLMQIQRDLGLRPLKRPTKPGRPGTFAPRVVTGHWTAARSSAARPAPSENIVRDGFHGLSGPLYGDLVPYQTDMNDLVVIPITIGRSNNSGIGHLSVVNAARDGRTTRRRATSAGSSGLNGVTDAVSADYHPAQGPPPSAMVVALERAMAARIIYRGLHPMASTDHAQQTSRKIDLLQHWFPNASTFEAWRVRVADLVGGGAPEPEPDPAPNLVEDHMLVTRRTDKTRWHIAGGWRYRIDDSSWWNLMRREGVPDLGEVSPSIIALYPWNREGMDTWPTPVSGAAQAAVEADAAEQD